jgi:hypothetical protein
MREVAITTAPVRLGQFLPDNASGLRVRFCREVLVTESNRVAVIGIRRAVDVRWARRVTHCL